MFLNLGLGRMGCLVGALGISAALDLNFASGTFPREVTHSRSGAATQVYDDGLVDYAPENLLLYSSTISNAAWTGSNRTISDNTTADPPGTTGGTTADTIVEDTSVGAFHWIAQAVTKPAVAERYLFTGYCHSSSARDIAVYLQNGANGCNARFRPSTGVNTGPAATFGSGWSSVSSSITSIGGGWHRFALQATSDGTTSITAQIALYNAAFSYTGDGVSGAVVYGLRLQRGTHSRAEDDFLLQTTSAAVYGPRITYDPSSLACLGYLNEPQRTNQYVGSASVAGFAPLVGTVTATPNYGADAFGAAATTTRWQCDGTNRFMRWVSGNCGIDADSTGYCVSFFYRGSLASIAAVSGRSGAWVAPTDLGTAGPGGIKRAFAAITSGATGVAYLDFAVQASSDVQIWGLQVEKNATVPSSYIPTTGTSATRAADVAYVDVATWLPALSMTNATLYAEVQLLEVVTFARILGTNSGVAPLYVGTSATEVGTYDGATPPTVAGSSMLTAARKMAVSLGAGSRVVALAGATTTDASNASPLPTRLYIGSNQGTTDFLSGLFKTTRAYYGAQSATQIATLTT